MKLGELIAALQALDPSRLCPIGFKKPHSYHGYYDCLAFEPATDVTVGAMLKDAEYAAGKEFTGYKGGEFLMTAYTDVWLSRYGYCGETIGPVLLSFMVGAAVEGSPFDWAPGFMDVRVELGKDATIRELQSKIKQLQASVSYYKQMIEEARQLAKLATKE